MVECASECPSAYTAGDWISPTSASSYYPLGASRSRTGFPFSVSAPFEMNEDRSQVLDMVNSDWNAWLIEELAGIAMRLLAEELFRAYGVDAYIVLDYRDAAAGTSQSLQVPWSRYLRENACWPTELASTQKNLVPFFKPIQALSLPMDSSLSGFAYASIRGDRLSHSSICRDERARSLALQLGGRPFTLNNLVRLRCAGEDKSGLATEHDEGSVDYHFPTISESWRTRNFRSGSQEALDAQRSKLTETHKHDLRESISTLTEAGTLGRLDAPLWVVG